MFAMCSPLDAGLEPEISWLPSASLRGRVARRSFGYGLRQSRLGIPAHIRYIATRCVNTGAILIFRTLRRAGSVAERNQNRAANDGHCSGVADSEVTLPWALETLP